MLGPGLFFWGDLKIKLDPEIFFMVFVSPAQKLHRRYFFSTFGMEFVEAEKPNEGMEVRRDTDTVLYLDVRILTLLRNWDKVNHL